MIAQLRPTSFAQWLQSLGERTALVLDVREPWEYDLARIAPLANSPAFDVLHMPMQSIPARLNELPQDRPMAILCHHGVRSQQVAAYLLHHDFEQVVNIAGGIEAWAREADLSVAQY